MSARRGAIAVGVACAALFLAGQPAFADDRRDTSPPSAVQPFRFPGTTPLTQGNVRFPGTVPMPSVPGTVPMPSVQSPQRPQDGTPEHDRDRRQHHHHHGSPVFVLPPPVYYYTPRPSGSWSYRWVPRYVQVPVWIDGHWTPDGRWQEGRYESRWSDYGAWEPYWVPSY